MSNFEPLHTSQPDWREPYSAFPLPGEHSLLQAQQAPYHSPSSTSNNNINGQNQHHNHQSGSGGGQQDGRPQLEHRHSLGLLRQDAQAQVPQMIERPDSAPVGAGGQSSITLRHDSLVSSESTALSLGSNPLSSASSAHPQIQQQGTNASDENLECQPEIKDEEDDDIDDDDDMLDAEEGGGSVPQTAAERRAERRKMKRFRLTHQQTRFLMSEFAKQAHPDAAHRERLSREIPGLSPRQVQVWFQNRRAKIKRLTADDRDRMMKMRAVPDDFDNVQALHSPYGAVHGLQSPVDFYPDHMMRPLMVDTLHRPEHDEHLSPTGLSPAFGHVGFAPPGSMGTPDVLSPLSLNSGDRYFGHSPLSAGPRSAGAFDSARQGQIQGNNSNSNNSNSSNGFQNQMSHQQRQQVRQLQPLQLRETMSRSRSESLQSPLRTSMSWKGDSIDYGNYQTSTSPRQGSVYQPPGDAQQANQSAASYDAGGAYGNANVQASPTHMTSYSSSHGPSASLQQSSPAAMARLRASSVAYPPGLDLRNQYRGLTGQPQQHHALPPTPRSSSFSSAFTAGYGSAPLTAPVEFSLPRTPIDGPGAREYGLQLSAPMQPPQDFGSSYRARPQAQEHGQGQQQPHGRSHEEPSYLRAGEYDGGHKRKRSFTLPGQYLQSP